VKVWFVSFRFNIHQLYGNFIFLLNYLDVQFVRLVNLILYVISFFSYMIILYHFIFSLRINVFQLYIVLLNTMIIVLCLCNVLLKLYLYVITVWKKRNFIPVSRNSSSVTRILTSRMPVARSSCRGAHERIAPNDWELLCWYVVHRSKLWRVDNRSTEKATFRILILVS
jgi:hypothetical protein